MIAVINWRWLRVLPVLIFAFYGSLSYSNSYGGHPAAVKLAAELVAEHGFDATALAKVFARAERQQSILDAISRPAEKSKAWHEYRDIFLTEKREARGIDFYYLHRHTLQRASREFGVPAEIIVAIMGVETFYGRITGSYRVIDALTTLAFDYPRRSAFFSRELKQFLILSREQGLDPLTLKGSYAGAMGFGQFMPSSYRSYAVDFDGDGKVDIWANPVDAIGSIANYFKRHGWQPGQPVTSAVQVVGSPPADLFNNGLKPRLSVAEFTAAGITTASSLPGDALATAMQFEGKSGPEYWMGLHNFYVITRYNHSAMYAMSVYQLSQRILQQINP